MSFIKKISVDVHDVDFNGECKVSAMMRYFQSAAQAQLTESGLSYDAMKANKRVFVLSQMRMEFYGSVRAFEPLDAVTFPCESRGYSFLRCYRLLRDGEVIGQAVSVWALINTETRGLVRVSDFNLPLPSDEPLALTNERICMPSAMTEVGTYRVNYGDLDRNRHMNNTHYPDMFAEFLPMEGMRMSSLSVHFIKEAPAGEVLRVERGYEDGFWYIRTVRSDGMTNCEAKAELTKITL